MGTDEKTTLEGIRAAGKQEFLEKGFQAASLRNIVKNAGVTTGAFYGYFSSKEALFAALVEKHAAAVMGYFMQAQEAFEVLPKEEQEESMGQFSGACLDKIVDYAYEHYDYFKLLVCCADGTAYESFLHNMVEVEVDSTYRFLEVREEMGHEVPKLDRDLCHMICSGMFSGMFEMIVHDMPKENVKCFIHQLNEFYQAGWSKIMGIDSLS